MPLYLVTSPKGKRYVGITTRKVNRRMIGHQTAARLGSTSPFHAAIRKYGFDAMKVETLHDSCDLDELHALEVQTIAELNTLAPNGYNLTSGGEGTSNHVVTDEQKANLSRCMQARWNDPDFVAMRKEKSSEQARRLNADPEHKAKFQAASRAYWTHERLAKRAAVVEPKQKALWADPEYRAKHAARLIEMNKSPEKRAAVSASTKLARAKQSPERRREIAAMAVTARAEKRARIDALPSEERDRIKAEQYALKSASTKAGRAAAKASRTPEEQAAVSERYRQAALRRTPEQLAKLRESRNAARKTF